MIVNPFYTLKPRTFDKLTLGLLQIQDFSEIQDASSLKSICIIEPIVDSESASQQSWLNQIKKSLEKLNHYDTMKVSCKQLFIAFFSSSNQFSIIRIRVDVENETNVASKVMIYQSMETELPELLAVAESLTKIVKGVFTADTGSETIRTHITSESYSSGFLALLNLRTLFKGEEPAKEVIVPFGAYELRRKILDDLKQMSSKTKELVEKFEVLQFEDIDIENPFILRELFDKFFKGLTRADRRELRDLSYRLALQHKQAPTSFFPSLEKGRSILGTQEIDTEIKILDPLINWLKKRSDKLREAKAGIISLFDLIFYQHNSNEARQSQMIIRLNHVMRLIPDKNIITISTIGDELRKTKEIIETTLAKEDIEWNDKLLMTNLEEHLIGSRIDNLDGKSSLVMCLTRHLTDYYKPINLKNKSRKNKIVLLYEDILPTVAELSEERLVAKILTEKVEDTLVNAYLVNLTEKKLKPLYVQERKGDEQEIPLVLMKTNENQYITFTSMQKFCKLTEYAEWLTGQIVNDKLIMPTCLKIIQGMQNAEQIFSYVSEIYQKVKKTTSIEELNSQLQGILLNDHAFFNELSKIEKQLSIEQKSDILAKVRSSVLSLLQSAFEEYNQLILLEHHNRVLEAEREIIKAEEEKNQRIKEIIETENAIKAEQAELERLQKLAEEAMAKSEAEKAELDAQIKQNQEEIQRKTELARKKKALQTWTSLLEDISAITLDTIKKRDTYMQQINSGFSNMTALKDFALTLVSDKDAYDQELLDHFCSLHSEDHIAKNVQYLKNILNPPKATLTNDILKITGYSFTLNEALLSAKDLLTPNVKTVHALAVRDLFVEPLANQDTFLETNLYLCTTNINIEDDVVIKTNGRPLPALDPTKAPNGKDAGMSGDRGINGKTGGNAGNVVLKAQGVIKDVQRLEIIANGGDGQQGQDGGDGAQGASGRSGLDGKGEKIEHNRLLGLYKASVEKGTSGTAAGDGGMGGAGGLGGQGGACGQVSLLDKDGDQTSKIKVTAKPGVQGKDGTPGQGGKGGKPGENGIDFGKQQVFFEKTTLRGTVGLKFVESWNFNHWEIYLEKNEEDTRMPKYGAGKDGSVMQLVEDTAKAKEAAQQQLVIPAFDELDMMKLSFAAKNFSEADQIQDTDFQLDQNIHEQVTALKEGSDALQTEITKANEQKAAGAVLAQDKMKVLGDEQNKLAENQKLLQEKVSKLEDMVSKEKKEFDEAVKKRDEMNKMFSSEQQIVTQLNETVQRVSEFKESSPSRKRGLNWPSGQPFNQSLKFSSTLTDSKLKLDWATLEVLLNKHKHTARVFVEHFIDLLETFVLLFFSEQSSSFSKDSSSDDENVKASTVSALSSFDTITLLECSKILRSAIDKKLNKVALDPQEVEIKDLFFALIEDKNTGEADDLHPDFIKAKTKLDQLYGYLVKLCLSQPKAEAIEYMKSAIKVDAHKKPENKLSKLFWKHSKHLGRFFSNFRKSGRNFRFDMVSKIKTMIELATNTEEGNDGLFMTHENSRDRKIIFNLEMCSMSRHYFSGEYTVQDYPLDAAMDDFNYTKSPDALLKVVMTFEQQMSGPDSLSVAPSRLAGEPSIFFVLTVYKAIAHLDLTPTHLVLMRSGFARILNSGVLYKSNARFEMMLDQCEKLTKARLRSWENVYTALEKVLTVKNQLKPEKVEEQSLLIFIKTIYRLENSTLPSSTKTNRKTRLCEKLSSQNFSLWSSIIEEKDLTQNYWNLIRRSWSKLFPAASGMRPASSNRTRIFRSRPAVRESLVSLVDSQLDEDTIFKDDMIKKAGKLGDHEFVDDVRKIFEKVSSVLRNAPSTPEFRAFKQAFQTKLSKLFDELASMRRSEDKQKLKLMSQQVLQKCKALLHELVTFCDVQRLQQHQETEIAAKMERTIALRDLLKDTNSSFEFGAVMNDSAKEAIQGVFIRLETLREQGEFNQSEELLCQRIRKRITDYGEEYFIKKFVDLKDNQEKNDVAWTILSRTYKTLLTFTDESFARVSPIDIADFILYVMVMMNEKRKKEENKAQPMSVQGYVSWFCLHLLKPQDQDQNINKDQDPSSPEPAHPQDPPITYEYVKSLMNEKPEWKAVFEKCVKMVSKNFRLLNRVIFVIKCYDWDERALNTLREVINDMSGDEKNLNESLTLIAQMVLDRFKELFLKPLVDKIVTKAQRDTKILTTAKLEQMLEFIHLDTDLPALKVSLNGVVACAESLVTGPTEYREKVDICFKHILVFSDSVISTLKDLKSLAKDFNKSLKVGALAYEKDFLDRIQALLNKLNSEVSNNSTYVRSLTPVIIRVVRIVSIAIQQAYIQYETLDKLDKTVYNIRILIEAKNESPEASVSYETNAVFIQYLQSSKQVWIQKLDQMFADFKKVCCLDEEFVQEKREKVLDRIHALVSHVLPDEKRRILDLVDYNLRKIEYIWILASKMNDARLDFIPEVYKKLEENLTESEENSYESTHYEMIEKFLTVLSKASSELCKNFTHMFGSENLNNVNRIITYIKKVKEAVTEEEDIIAKLQPAIDAVKKGKHLLIWPLWLKDLTPQAELDDIEALNVFLKTYPESAPITDLFRDILAQECMAYFTDFKGIVGASVRENADKIAQIYDFLNDRFWIILDECRKLVSLNEMPQKSTAQFLNEIFAYLKTNLISSKIEDLIEQISKIYKSRAEEIVEGFSKLLLSMVVNVKESSAMKETSRGGCGLFSCFSGARNKKQIKPSTPPTNDQKLLLNLIKYLNYNQFVNFLLTVLDVYREEEKEDWDKKPSKLPMGLLITIFSSTFNLFSKCWSIPELASFVEQVLPRLRDESNDEAILSILQVINITLQTRIDPMLYSLTKEDRTNYAGMNYVSYLESNRKQKLIAEVKFCVQFIKRYIMKDKSVQDVLTLIREAGIRFLLANTTTLASSSEDLDKEAIVELVEAKIENIQSTPVIYDERTNELKSIEWRRLFISILFVLDLTVLEKEFVRERVLGTPYSTCDRILLDALMSLIKKPKNPKGNRFLVYFAEQLTDSNNSYVKNTYKLIFSANELGHLELLYLINEYHLKTIFAEIQSQLPIFWLSSMKKLSQRALFKKLIHLTSDSKQLSIQDKVKALRTHVPLIMRENPRLLSQCEALADELSKDESAEVRITLVDSLRKIEIILRTNEQSTSYVTAIIDTLTYQGRLQKSLADFDLIYGESSRFNVSLEFLKKVVLKLDDDKRINTRNLSACLEDLCQLRNPLSLKKVIDKKRPCDWRSNILIERVNDIVGRMCDKYYEMTKELITSTRSTKIKDMAKALSKHADLLETFLKKLEIELGLVKPDIASSFNEFEQVLEQLYQLEVENGLKPSFTETLIDKPFSQMNMMLEAKWIEVKLDYETDALLPKKVKALLLNLQQKLGRALVRKLSECPAIKQAEDLKIVVNLLSTISNHVLILDDEIYETKLKDRPIGEWEEILKMYTEEQMKMQRDYFTMLDLLWKDNIDNELMKKRLKKWIGEMCTSLEKVRKEDSSILKRYGAIGTWNSKTIIQEWTRELMKKGLDDRGKMLPEILAVVFQGYSITKDLKEYPRGAQVIVILLLLQASIDLQGRLGQVSTGEGKTLIVACFAVLRVLHGDKVDIISSSSVLASRDAEKMQNFYSMFDIAASCNCDEKSLASDDVRRQKYKAHVVYGDLATFQRDVLLTDFYKRDTFAGRKSNCLIVDEVDSMLLDKGENMLYLSHNIPELWLLIPLLIQIWQYVHAPDVAFGTPDDIKKIQALILKQIRENEIPVPASLMGFVERVLMTRIKKAFQAASMKEDDSYTVTDAIVVVDNDTGVEQMNTQWSQGLHQFMQIKHLARLSPETLRAVFISNLSYFRRFAGRLYGLTGTLGSKRECDFLSKIYAVEVFKMPRYKLRRYVQTEPLVANDKSAWHTNIISVIQKYKEEKRAMLFICENLGVTQELFKIISGIWPQRTYKYAAFSTLEVGDDSNPMKPGDVLIATNIAGRGTDLELDNQVLENGGLHTVLTYMPHNIRIEEQAFGRSARNGMPGSGQFVIVCPITGLSVEEVRRDRDERECQRIEDIKIKSVQKIEKEEELFSQFMGFYEKVSDCLRRDLKQQEGKSDKIHKVLYNLQSKLSIGRSSDRSYIDKQLKALLTGWAFWLDSVSDSLNTLYKTDHKFLDKKFNEFIKGYISDLKKNEENGLLIKTPLGLTELARQFEEQDNNKLAQRIYQAVIESEPNFCEAALCYNAVVKIKEMGSLRKIESEIKHDLRKAEKLIRKKINYYSSSMMILRHVDDKRRKQGCKGNVDRIQGQIHEMIRLYGLHLKTIEDFLGTNIDKSFIQKVPRMNGDDMRAKMLEYLQEECEEWIKPFRLSKKVSIKQDEIMILKYNGKEKAITIPSDLLFIKADLIEDFTKRIKNGNRKFLQKYLNIIVQDKKSLWEIFEQAKILKKTGEVNMLNTSDPNKIASFDFSYLDRDDVRKVLAIFTNGSTTGWTYKDFSSFLDEDEYADLVKHLTGLNMITVVPRGVLSLVIKRLGNVCLLDLPTKVEEYRMVLEEIPRSKKINLASIMSGKLEIEMSMIDIPGPATREDGISRLWIVFMKKGVVKFPSLKVNKDVNFRKQMPEIDKRVSQLLDKIKARSDKDTLFDFEGLSDTKIHAVKSEFSRLFKGTVGLRKKIKTEIKVGYGQINEFLPRDTRTPDTYHMLVALEFHRVLVFEKKRKIWDWNVFCVFMIGLAEVAAAATITVFSCAAGLPFSHILLTEGFKDMTYAIKMAISGEFSWDEYLYQKAIGLGLSVLFSGVAPFLGIVSIVEPSQSYVVYNTTKDIIMAGWDAFETISVNFVINDVVTKCVYRLIASTKKLFRKEFDGKIEEMCQAAEKLFDVCTLHHALTCTQEHIQRVSKMFMVNFNAFRENLFDLIDNIFNLASDFGHLGWKDFLLKQVPNLLEIGQEVYSAFEIGKELIKTIDSFKEDIGNRTKKFEVALETAKLKNPDNTELKPKEPDHPDRPKFKECAEKYIKETIDELCQKLAEAISSSLFANRLSEVIGKKANDFVKGFSNQLIETYVDEKYKDVLDALVDGLPDIGISAGDDEVEEGNFDDDDRLFFDDLSSLRKGLLGSDGFINSSSYLTAALNRSRERQNLVSPNKELIRMTTGLPVVELDRNSEDRDTNEFIETLRQNQLDVDGLPLDICFEARKEVYENMLKKTKNDAQALEACMDTESIRLAAAHMLRDVMPRGEYLGQGSQNRRYYIELVKIGSNQWELRAELVQKRSKCWRFGIEGSMQNIKSFQKVIAEALAIQVIKMKANYRSLSDIQKLLECLYLEFTRHITEDTPTSYSRSTEEVRYIKELATNTIVKFKEEKITLTLKML